LVHDIGFIKNTYLQKRDPTDTTKLRMQQCPTKKKKGYINYRRRWSYNHKYGFFKCAMLPRWPSL